MRDQGRVDRLLGVVVRMRRLMDGVHPNHEALVDLEGMEGLLGAMERCLAGERVAVVSAKAASLGHGAGADVQVVRKGPKPPVSKPGMAMGWQSAKAKAAREAQRVAALEAGEVVGADGGQAD